jgi:actin
MFSGDEVGAVVGDVGSHTVKFGLGGEDTPRYITPAAAAVEDEAAHWLKGLAKMNLRSAENHPMLATCSTLATDKDRAKQTEMLMEKIHAPCMFLMRSAVLCAFASGRANALMVEASASSCTVTPVLDGHALLRPTRHATELGGNAVSSRVAKLLKTSDLLIADDCKHLLCKVWRPMMFDSAAASAALTKETYEMPDKTKIEVSALDRYAVCEDLFHEDNGLGALVYDSVAACEPGVRKSMLQEVVVVGGSSLLDGLPERLGNDLVWRLPSAFKPKVLSPGSTAEKRFSAFVGGSVLCSLGSFQQLWLSRKEYDEFGAARVVVERFVH